MTLWLWSEYYTKTLSFTLLYDANNNNMLFNESCTLFGLTALINFIDVELYDRFSYCISGGWDSFRTKFVFVHEKFMRTSSIGYSNYHIIRTVEKWAFVRSDLQGGHINEQTLNTCTLVNKYTFSYATTRC